MAHALLAASARAMARVLVVDQVFRNRPVVVKNEVLDVIRSDRPDDRVVTRWRNNNCATATTIRVASVINQSIIALEAGGGLTATPRLIHLCKVAHVYASEYNPANEVRIGMSVHVRLARVPGKVKAFAVKTCISGITHVEPVLDDRFCRMWLCAVPEKELVHVPDTVGEWRQSFFSKHVHGRIRVFTLSTKLQREYRQHRLSSAVQASSRVYLSNASSMIFSSRGASPR